MVVLYKAEKPLLLDTHMLCWTNIDRTVSLQPYSLDHSKMKSIFFALSTVVASLAVAAPWNGGYGSGCISQSDAELLVSRYAAVIAAQNSDLGGELPGTK